MSYTHPVVVGVADRLSFVADAGQMYASKFVCVANGDGAAMELNITPMERIYDIRAKLIPGRDAEGPNARLQLSGLQALGKKLSSSYPDLLASDVFVEYQGADVLRNYQLFEDGTWRSQQETLFFTLGSLNPLKLSLRGISLTRMDLSIISHQFGSLTALELLAPSEYHPMTLKPLEALPHLRELTLDATMCRKSSFDDEEAQWYDQLFNAVTELYAGPSGRTGPGGRLVTLQYKCAADDPDEYRYHENLLDLAESIERRLGEGSKVKVTVELVPE